MQRFFFDVSNGLGLVVDEQGQDLRGAEQVRVEALLTAHGIASDEMLKGLPRMWSSGFGAQTEPGSSRKAGKKQRPTSLHLHYKYFLQFAQECASTMQSGSLGSQSENAAYRYQAANNTGTYAALSV